MAATNEQVAELREMIDEPDTTTYSDDLLKTYIERFPLNDLLGTKPRVVRYTTQPPTIAENPNWIPTYDLHRAAGLVWMQKAGKVAEDYNYSADGASLQRGEVHKHYLAMARYHRSMRAATSRTITPAEREGSTNLAESEMFSDDEVVVL